MARWLIWIVFVIAWSVALELPVAVKEEMPGGEFILSYRDLFSKSLHVLAYAFFTGLSGWMPIPARYRWLMMFFLMTHAWGTEMLQFQLREYCGRTGSLGDVGFDVIGIILGGAVTWRWWTRGDG